MPTENDIDCHVRRIMTRSGESPALHVTLPAQENGMLLAMVEEAIETINNDYAGRMDMVILELSAPQEEWEIVEITRYFQVYFTVVAWLARDSKVVSVAASRSSDYHPGNIIEFRRRESSAAATSTGL